MVYNISEIERKSLIQKAPWLVNLRWVAIIGIGITVAVTRFIINIDLNYIYIYYGTLILFLYNLTIHFIVKKLIKLNLETPVAYKKFFILANIQISLDLILLTYFVHFSGGIENPSFFFFIFHVVIAGIILEVVFAYVYATLAVGLILFIVVGEKIGFINHYHLSYVLPPDVCMLDYNLSVIMFIAFALTIYMAAYFTTSIVQEQRRGERKLEELNKKLEEYDKLKSKYVQRVSHDIQSTISTIQSCLAVVTEGVTGPVSEKSMEMVRRAKDRSEDLHYFVRKLWELSQLRTMEKIPCENLDIVEVVNSVIDSYQSSLKKKNLKIEIKRYTQNTVIPGNRYILEEMFSDLLSNSMKYCRKGCKIEVSFSDYKNGDGLLIEWKDNGIGIPKDELHLIFEDFYRASNARKFTDKGYGIGCAIIKRVIELHNGRIEVESVLDKGTSFFLRFSRLTN